jgi:hypothetical protein
VCRQIQAWIGAPVLGLVPPETLGEPVADLYMLPLPVDPCALRKAVRGHLAMRVA